MSETVLVVVIATCKLITGPTITTSSEVTEKKHQSKWVFSGVDIAVIITRHTTFHDHCCITVVDIQASELHADIIALEEIQLIPGLWLGCKT